MISKSFNYKYSLFALQIALTFLFSTSYINGQSKNDEEESILRVNFSVFSFKRLSGLHYLKGDLSDGVPLKFYSSDRSPMYTFEGQNPIIFFRETPAPTDIDPNAIKRLKVAEISIPQSGGDYLFIFFKNSKSESESYRIFPLDDSLAVLPYGSVRFFNATTHELIGKLGKSDISIGPGPSKSYQLKGNSHSLTYGFKYDDKFYLSYQSPFQLSQDVRGIFMISPPFIKGSSILQTRLLRDAKLYEDADQNVLQSD